MFKQVINNFLFGKYILSIKNYLIQLNLVSPIIRFSFKDTDLIIILAHNIDKL